MPSAPYNLSPDGQTFIARDNSFAGLEIGDIKQKAFFPQFKVRRWGQAQDECNFSARLGGALLAQETEPQISQRGNKISWIGKQTQVDFYDRGGLQEDTGGYEMDVTLLVKPASPVIPVTLNVPKNLDFFYQPPLTAEEIADGCTRPDKVVGSYALYHQTMAGDYTAFGLDNYKAGKFGHIYRPWLLDANGQGVWGELNIDPIKQLLTVTMPIDFYNSCAWPVRQAAGLEFGYQTIGASTNSVIYGTLWVFQSYTTPAQNGILTDLMCYCSAASATDWAPALYSDSSGTPNNRLAYASDGPAVGSSYAWIDAPLNYNNIQQGLYYWFGVTGTVNGVTIAIAMDSGSGNIAGFNNIGSPTWPDPFPGPSYRTFRDSIYGVYIPSTAANIPYHLLFNQPKGVF